MLALAERSQRQGFALVMTEMVLSLEEKEH